MGKKDSGKVAQTGLFNFERLGKGSKILKASRFELFDFFKVVHIILDGDSSLNDVGVLQNLDQRPEFHNGVETKKKGLVGSGQLQKSGGIVGATLEVGLALDIEPENFLFTQPGDKFIERLGIAS